MQPHEFTPALDTAASSRNRNQACAVCSHTARHSLHQGAASHRQGSPVAAPDPRTEHEVAAGLPPQLAGRTVGQSSRIPHPYGHDPRFPGSCSWCRLGTTAACHTSSSAPEPTYATHPRGPENLPAPQPVVALIEALADDRVAEALTELEEEQERVREARKGGEDAPGRLIEDEHAMEDADDDLRALPVWSSTERNRVAALTYFPSELVRGLTQTVAGLVRDAWVDGFLTARKVSR